MSSAAAVADVIEAFKRRGFEFVGKTDDGWFKLHGRLTPPKSDKGCPCEVQLDPTFFDLPRIRLLEIPPALPAAVPHLGADGGLCYLAKGTVVLDIYDPVGQSLACLQRASLVFGQIVKGEMVEDLAEEFFAYWVVRSSLSVINHKGFPLACATMQFCRPKSSPCMSTKQSQPCQ